MIIFILFLISVISTIILGFITDKITEGYRSYPNITGIHIVFCLLKVYKKTNNIKYLILFIADFVLYISCFVIFFIVDWDIVSASELWEFIRVGKH